MSAPVLATAETGPQHDATGGQARVFLDAAREHERAGRMTEAVAAYGGAIAAAEASGESVTLAEALRRLGVVRHLLHETEAGRELCQRSYDVACAAGHDVLAAEATNALAGIAYERGELDAAAEVYRRALRLGIRSADLRGRVEQNLGIIASVHGDYATALAHYHRALDAFRTAQDEHGRGIAYQNLGILSAHHEKWEDAEEYFQRALEVAEAGGDVRLRALCLLNRTQVLLARQRYEEVRQDAETALAIFEQLGCRRDKAAAYKVLGVVYRETGRPALAEARLRSAIDVAAETGSVLGEAEASRELAILHQATGRNQDALALLNTAYRLFHRLAAHVDLVDVGSKVARLEATYLALTRDWGQSIESADSYTFGHCERVAGYAVAVAQALGLDDSQCTTVRIGAYLHDLGKVKVPHEILNKAGSLTREEFEVVQLHSIWGIELLAGVEFPWDIKPIIRWHHERYDGTGYPDRLRGDEIPRSAQIVAIVDVYDALTSSRPYRPAFPHAAALAEMERCQGWWSGAVYRAFRASLAEPLTPTAGAENSSFTR